ncbi:hypothetical protein [Deinococcus sp.]|uniref:hypothetical protein n=1 Tax=Deinococcus sp. TaxID=47478 RepID=UPI0025BFF5BE|nr:hypothetical protein [Deinococcus sp.]
MEWPDPTDFVHGDPLPPFTAWARPGLVMTFNLECPGCATVGACCAADPWGFPWLDTP